MPRPSRRTEAKQELRKHHAEQGGMPSIGVFAGAMRYASTVSAYDAVEKLVAVATCVQTGREGAGCRARNTILVHPKS